MNGPEGDARPAAPHEREGRYDHGMPRERLLREQPLQRRYKLPRHARPRHAVEVLQPPDRARSRGPGRPRLLFGHASVLRGGGLRHGHQLHLQGGAKRKHDGPARPAAARRGGAGEVVVLRRGHARRGGPQRLLRAEAPARPLGAVYDPPVERSSAARAEAPPRGLRAIPPAHRGRRGGPRRGRPRPRHRGRPFPARRPHRRVRRPHRA